MIQVLKELARKAGTILFPPVCGVCDTAYAADCLKLSICQHCWRELRPIGTNVCSLCGVPLASPEPGKVWHDFKCGDCRRRSRVPYDLMRALYYYEQALPPMIRRMKFENHPELCRELGRRLASFAAEWSYFRAADAVVPVPISFRRYLRRGFNQSGLLARRVAAELGVPCEQGMLRRHRHRKPQSLVPDEDRRKNVRGSFRAGREVQSKKVVLVDDIVTSGATVEECARTLKRAGAAEVMVLTLARARTA